jgi:lipoate-protein ligase A
VLRLYRWDRPAVSFGYFQSYDAIANLTPVRPLVRRLTGGGLVSHVADWT